MTERLEPPRIAIYGVGQYGTMIARLATAKGWPIVAAFNRAGPKVGQDLGRVAGLDRDLGVVIQDNETGDYDGLDADVGVVTHMDLLRHNMDAYRRFMRAGLNIACHGGQSYLPQTNDPVLASEIEALAVTNGVTFTGSGIWDMSRIWAGILTAGPCTDITSLHHRSLTDPEGQLLSLTRGSAFNQPPERFYERGLDQSPVLLAHKAIPELVLRALGYHVAESRAAAEPVVYDVPVKTKLIPEGVFEAGVCVGVRTQHRGRHRGGRRRHGLDRATHVPARRRRAHGLGGRGNAAEPHACRTPRLGARPRPGTCSTASPTSSRRRRASSRSPSWGPLRSSANRWPRSAGVSSHRLRLLRRRADGGVPSRSRASTSSTTRSSSP